MMESAAVEKEAEKSLTEIRLEQRN